MKRHVLAAVTLILFSSIAYSAPNREAITIWSDGVRLAGDLWKPEGLGENEKRPAVLLAHGWGGEKSHLNQAYAPQFAELGYIVLTFDYRGWGESDGKLIRVGDKPSDTSGDFAVEVREVRTMVDPLDELEDIRAAHAYLIGEPQVDGTRLAIWGSSLGGGLVLQSAAILPGFKVMITQVGAVNPRAGENSADPNAPLSPENMQMLSSAVARGDLPPFPGAEAGVPGLRGFPIWPRMVRYDPFAYAEKLTAATLIIDAADEELFDITQNGEALYRKIRNQVPARYETIPGKHYDVYSGPGYAAAIAMEKAWLAEHLPVK